jgi:hypothetical protein
MGCYRFVIGFLNFTRQSLRSYADKSAQFTRCGLPAFGKVESDEHIWNLVHHLKTMRGSAHAESEPPQ